MTGHQVNRTLLIGLGGQGQSALAAAKRRMLDAYGEVPPVVKFLAIDSGPLAGDNGNLGVDEYVLISVPNAAAYIGDHREALSQWLDYEHLPRSTLLNSGKGAGQIPMIGRFLLLYHLRQILGLIEAKLAAAMSAEVLQSRQWDVGATKPQVIFFGSIAGGTGAGTLLDLACALRTRTSGHWDHQAFLMLPGVFRNFMLTPYVEENGYAFLKQLDFFMSERNEIVAGTYGDLFDVKTQDGVEYQFAHPFDQITLIGNMSQGAVPFVHQDPRDLTDVMAGIAQRRVAQAFADFGSPLLINPPNFAKPWDGGKLALYRGVGIAVLRYPKKEVEDCARCAFIVKLVDALRTIESANDAGAIDVIRQAEAFRNELAFQELGPEQNQILETILPASKFSGFAAGIPSKITKADEAEEVWKVSAAELNRKIDDWVAEAANNATGDNGLLNKVKTALEKKTDELLTTYDADLAARFLQTLAGYFESVKGEMAAESRAAAGAIASLQTSILGQKEKCSEATKKLFGKKDAIEKALRDYRFMLQELAAANGERIRTAQAVEFCTKMGATLSDASARLGRRGELVDELGIKSYCALQDAKREIDKSESYEFVVKPDLGTLKLSPPRSR